MKDTAIYNQIKEVARYSIDVDDRYGCLLRGKDIHRSGVALVARMDDYGDPAEVLWVGRAVAGDFEGSERVCVREARGCVTIALRPRSTWSARLVTLVLVSLITHAWDFDPTSRLFD